MSAAVTHPGLAHSVPITLLPVVFVDALGTAHHPDAKMRRTRCDRVGLERLRRTTLDPGDRVCKGCDRAGRRR